LRLVRVALVCVALIPVALVAALASSGALAAVALPVVAAAPGVCPLVINHGALARTAAITVTGRPVTAPVIPVVVSPPLAPHVRSALREDALAEYAEAQSVPAWRLGTTRFERGTP